MFLPDAVLQGTLSRSTISKRYLILGTQLTEQLTQKQRRTIGLWLLGCAGCVYGAVALGGVTRYFLLTTF